MAPSGPFPPGSTINYAAVGASDVTGIGSSVPCLLADCSNGTGYVFVAESSFRVRLHRALAFVYESTRIVVFQECRWPYLALPGRDH